MGVRFAGRSREAAALLASAFCVFATTTAEAADIDRADAARKALSALNAERGDDALTVFALRTPLRAGTAITQAGPSATPQPLRGARPSAPLARAGVTTIAAGGVATTREPTWFFYADDGPSQAFEHPGRVVLVGRRTGKVTISRPLRWVPLVAGRLPAFFRTPTAYTSARYRVFDRPYSRRPAAAAKARAAAASPEARAAQQRLADALAAERSCALRVSDTLGDFYDFGRVDKTRAALGRLLLNLGRLNPAFVTRRYMPGAGDSPTEAAQALIAGGCRDLFLYAAGGAPRTGDAEIVTGTRPRGRRALQWHTLGADALEALVKRNPGVTFKFVFDAPYAGRIAARLRDERNVTVLLTAGGANEPSFTYLPRIDGRDGTLRNTSNPFRLLEFTNAVIVGVERFVTSPEEIDFAIAEQAAGRSDSVMAWMLARSPNLGPAPFSAALLGRPQQRVPFTPAPSKQGPVNHAPVPTTPTQVTVEDTPRNVTLTAVDPDGDPLTFAVTAPPAHGTLTGSAPFLRYTPARDFTGADRFSYSVADGRGGTATATANIVVTPDNDAPAIIVGPSVTPPSYTEQGPSVVVDGDLSIVDLDDTQLTGATVTIAAGRVAGDVLAFTPQPGITGAYDAATGVLTLTGTASLTAYRDALRSVRFSSTSDDPGTARTIRLRADDAGEAGIPVDREIVVVPENDGPRLTAPGTTTAGEDTPEPFTAGDPSEISIADPDAGGADVQATLAVDHGTLTLATTAGLTSAAGNGTGSITATGSLAEVNAALDGLTYTPAAGYTGADELRLGASDLGHTGTGGALTDTRAVTLTVTAVNDAPVNTVPGAQAFAEDGSVTLNGAFGVADADAGADDVRTTLAMPDGEIDVDASGTATITGNGSASVVVEGTLAEVGDALDAVTVGAESDVNGTFTLTMTTNDLGHSPAPAEEDVDTVAVTIGAVNDAPVITRPDGIQFTAEDTPLAFTGAASVSVADPDAGENAPAASDLDVDLSSKAGSRLSVGLTPPAGLTVAGNGTNLLSLTGTQADVNAALANLVYTPPAEDSGTDMITIVADDLGNAGTPGPLSDTRTITIDITTVDDAPVLGQPDGPLTYVEDDPADDHALAVAPSLTAADVDSSDAQGATVEITAGFASGEDELSVPGPLPGGITFSFTGDTATLSGTATVAQYEAALRQVRYANTSDDPSTATRTVTFTLTGSGGDSAPVTRDIAVDPRNDAPVVTTTSGDAAFVEDTTTEVAVDPTLTVADADDADLTGATVTIVANRDAGADELRFTNQNGITGSVNPTTGELTLSGTATVAQYQAALRTVRFATGGEPPSTATRTVQFTVHDGTVASAADTRDVTVTSVDDAPLVDTSAGAVDWREGDPAVAVDPGIEVSDADDTHLESATVTVGAGRDGDDLLAATPAGGITVGTYNDTTGVLTFSGTATVEDYETTLRSVTFVNTGGSPGASRTIEFRVHDGDKPSPETNHTRDVTIENTNSKPSITGVDGTASYTENAAAVVVESDLTVADLDSPQLTGGSVVISGGFQPGDELLDTPQGPVDGTYDPDTGILLISGTGTLAQYEAYLENVRYRTTEDAPDTTGRTIEFQVSDGEPANPLSDPVSKTVTVTADNDAPVVSTTAGAVQFVEGQTGATTIDGGLTLADADTASLTGATVAITLNYQAGQDVLEFTNQNGITGSYSAGTLTLTGTATVAQYEAALRTVAFSNGSQAPSTADRTITFTATDGEDTSAGATKTVEVDAVNDAPVLTQPDATLTYTEDTPSEDHLVAIAPGLTVTDEDDANLAGATVELDGLVSGQDELVFSDQNGITGTQVGDTLTLTGTASKADYQAALRTVRFRNTSENPDESTRTARFTVTDGHTGDNPESAPVTRDVDVVRTNDAPQPDAETFTGADGAVGNTALHVDDPTDTTPGPSHPHKAISGDLLDGDTDPDGPGPLVVQEGTFASADGGSVTIQADGDFTYHPAAATSCTDTTDSFQYSVSDQNPGTPGVGTGTVTIGIAGCVWYVRNTAGAGTGTSAAPFSTLAAAEAASGANHTVFVFDGDNTSAGLGGDGYTMNSGERLLGEHEGLAVDPDAGGPLGTVNLHPANANAHPTLTATNADVVTLASGAEVRGVNIDPQGTGGGISGGAGAQNTQIDDVNINDGGTLGTQPGLELVSLGGGTTTVTGLTVTTNGATGVRLSAAATVDFGTTQLTTNNAKALDVSGGSMGTSTFDAITVTGSTVGAVRLLNTTGTTVLGDGASTDLALAVTGGSEHALAVTNAGTVTVNPGGTDTLTASGGAPAMLVDTTTGSAFDLDTVTATDAGSAAVQLANNGGTTFTFGTSSSLSAASGAAVDLTGGSGTFQYPGTITNGAGGLSVSVQNRTGGTATFSGQITDNNDAAGGVSLSSNGTGTVRFDGGLNLSTGSSAAFSATGGGTVAVTDPAGAANTTLETTSGTALQVSGGTSIHADDLTFERISSNGAARGIYLDGTGTSGGLTVTGAGGTCTEANTSGCSGGAILNGTGGDDGGATPTGSGVVLNNTRDVSLTRMHLRDHTNYGIRGTAVQGFTLANSTITASGAGFNGTSSAAGNEEGGVRFVNLTGTATISGNSLSRGYSDNFRMVNDTGNVAITFTGNTVGTNNLADGNDGVLLETATGSSAAINATITSHTSTLTRGDHVQFSHNGTGAGNLSLTGSTFSNSTTPGSGGGGLTLSGDADAGNTTMTIDNNDFRDARGPAVVIFKSSGNGSATVSGSFTNNSIGVNGQATSGSSEGNALQLQNLQNGQLNFTVTGNDIHGYDENAIHVAAGGTVNGAGGTINTTITGNTIDTPGPLNTEIRNGIHYNIGVGVGDTFNVCADIRNNNVHASGLDSNPPSGAGNIDVRLRQRANTTIRLPGYSGSNTDNTAVQNFVRANNSIGGTPDVLAGNSGAGGGFTGGPGTCP